MPLQMAWANMQLMLHLAELWAIWLIYRILPERDGLMSTGQERSDPKVGNPADFPTGHGPQGDAIRIYNYVRLVRGGLWHAQNPWQDKNEIKPNHNSWDLKNMMKQFDVVIEKDSESYFVASVPALRGCHTQAKSLYVLIERIRESIELCLEVQGEIPEPLDFVGIQRISVAAWHPFQVWRVRTCSLDWEKQAFCLFELKGVTIEHFDLFKIVKNWLQDLGFI
jgi:predicted RNase H-like HicB family nuclease